MNRTLVKIVKRKDARVSADVKTQNTGETKLTATFGEEKIERRLHRKMADTVSNWIAERRENNRDEEVSAIRMMFGSESFLSKTA